MLMKVQINILLGIFLVLLLFTFCGQDQLQITTSSPEALQIYFDGVELAEKFLDNEAIEKFSAAIELDTTFAMAHYYLSRSYESAGNLTLAKQSIEKAKLYSGTTTPLEWVYINAWEKLLNNDLAGAMKIYQETIKDYSNDKHIMFVMGKTHRLMKNYQESEKVLGRLIKKHPHYAPAFNQLGYTYKEMGDFDKAIEYFKKYANLEPDQPNPFDSLGDMFRARGDYNNAIDNYKKALSVKPDFYTSLRNLGSTYLTIGEYEKSKTTYKKLLSLKPGREWQRDVYTDMAQIYLATGQFNEALKSINQSIMLSKSNFRKSYGIATKGYIYFLKNNYNEALRLFSASLTVLPEAIWAHEWKGCVFIKQKKYDLALSEAQEMKLLLERYGQTAYMSNYNALLGKIAMEQELYDEAIMYIKDAMKYDYQSNLYPMAYAYFKKGNFENAVYYINKIFSFNRNNGLAHFLLAQIYEKQNKQKLASAEYSTFLKIWKNADDDIREVQEAKARI